MAAIEDPIKIPKRAKEINLPSASSPPNASPARNIDIVKPIPHSTETAKICLKLIPSESLAIPNFTAIKLKLKTPKVFPTNKPKVTPKVSGEKSVFKLIPLSDTPAFEKANKGKITKAHHGARICSK